jgi:predicted RNA-binding protein with PIN domain
MQLLIDGHNLIGRMPNLRLDDPDDEEKLLEYLRRYRARTGHSLVVVFDAGQVYHPAKTKQQGGITIQFAPHGKTADQIIIQRVHRVKNPQGVMVVSSDRTVRQAAQQARVRILDAKEFARQLVQPAVTSETSENSQADIKLSPDEIEAWLALFNQSE